MFWFFCFLASSVVVFCQSIDLMRVETQRNKLLLLCTEYRNLLNKIVYQDEDSVWLRTQLTELEKEINLHD